MGCVVGPNGRGGEALYFNFNQAGAPLFLVQVDPDTGEARQFNAPQGPGAWALIAGPDEKIYLGTWDGGLILRFDPRQPEKGIEVVGKPSATEEYLWQFDLGKDGKLYACTYPQAKLVSFDPATGKMEDLGRMHPTEMYARSVAVGPNGKVYVGIGTEKGDLVVYRPGDAHASQHPAGGPARHPGLEHRRRDAPERRPGLRHLRHEPAAHRRRDRDARRQSAPDVAAAQAARRPRGDCFRARHVLAARPADAGRSSSARSSMPERAT